MRLRDVSREAIEHVLVHYDERRPAQPRVNAKPAEIFSGAYQGRRLKVYVEIDSDPPYIKTVAWND
jgi:hypothetical protein